MVLDAVPLLREGLDVVAPVVAQAGVHGGDLGDVRGVDDDLAAVGAHGLGLVEALGSGPDVVVHLRDQGHDALVGLVDVGEVGLRGGLGHRGAGGLRGPGGDRIQVRAAGGDVHGGGGLTGVDQRAGGGGRGANR